MFFWNSCFFYDPTDVGNSISGFSALSKSSLNIWKFMVQVLLKPGGTEARSLWLMGPRAQGHQWWSMGLVALRYMGSSWTRNCTCVSCIGRWVLILCATREVLHCVLRNEFVTNIWKLFIYNKNNSNFWSLLKIRWFSKTGSIFPSGNMAPLFFWPHRFQDPRPEVELMPLQWKYRVLTAGPARSPCLAPLNKFFCLPQPPPLPVLPPLSAHSMLPACPLWCWKD